MPGASSSVRKTLWTLLPAIGICVLFFPTGPAEGQSTTETLPEVPVYEEVRQKRKQSEYLKENLYKQVKKARPDRTPRRDLSRLAAAPGVFNIRKSGEGYDIDVQMDIRDFNDENMYFQMDLSTDEKDKKDEPAEGDEQPKDEPYPPEQGPSEAEVEAEPAKDKESLINLSNKHMLYAQTYLAEGKTERALFEVDRSLKAAPNSALALALKGSIYFKMGEIDLARAFWKKAYKIDPTLDNLKESLNKIGGE
jgi:tetratricopeptide (TPR) repeat protein